MKYPFLFILFIIIFSCENNSFDSDKRQLIAKSAIRKQLNDIQSFDITGFKEDTLQQNTNSAFKNLIRYTLNIAYKDSAGQMQNKEAYVLFTPDGKSIITSHINN